MKFSNISIKNGGYINCKSVFYSAQDNLNCDVIYNFVPGINKLVGEIDSGNWAASYLLSMYKCDPKAFILFEQPLITVDDKLLDLGDVTDYACYMDLSYPMFSSKVSVKKLICRGLKHSKIDYSPEYIIGLFDLDSQRVERPLSQNGNEAFRAMAAIGLAYGKEIFCFPWLSKKRYEAFHNNIPMAMEVLKDMGKTVILPIGE